MFKPIAATAPQIPSALPRRSDGSRASRGITLTEILVVIVIIAVLAAVLVPMFSRMRDKAHTAQCSGNLRSLGASIQLYAAENGGSLPFIGSDDFGRGVYWFNLIEPAYDTDAKKPSPSCFHCPADKRPQWKAKPGGGLNYGMNELLNRSRQSPATGVRLASVDKPSSTVLLTDAAYWVYVPSSDGYWGGQDMSVRRHSGGANFLMVDGSVAWSAKRRDFFYDAAGTNRGGFP
jgi:prepilin-type processing-associated H-X9-DG protein/prepilin-type N-terminal cleavage/methylation domain-containing protein